MAQPHKMILTNSDPAGNEEWLCPVCGRRLRLNWDTAPARDVLAPGDEAAVHTCEKGLKLDAPQAEDEDDAEVLARLRNGPWGQWLEKLDFDGDGTPPMN